jgi:TRAP transporter TAXI family solute receptor
MSTRTTGQVCPRFGVTHRLVRLTGAGAWLAALTVIGGFGAAPLSAAELQVAFIGGGATGAWTRNLTAMSECLRQHSDVRATVTPTQGGMDQFVKLNAGRGDFGFSYQNVLVDAWKGNGDFKNKPMRDLRVVGVAERLAVLHWVVSKSSGIKSIADLKGKRFAPGPIGTVSRAIVTNFLETAGVMKDIQVANVSSSEMNAYLRDGKLDGWAWMGSVPISPATEISVSKVGNLLDVQKEMEGSGFLSKNPFFVKVEIPTDAYPNMEKPVTSFGLNGVFIVHKAVPDETVYRVAKALWSNTCVDYLSKAQRSLVSMRDSPLNGLVFPLHPGAEKLWREKGLNISGIPTAEKF